MKSLFPRLYNGDNSHYEIKKAIDLSFCYCSFDIKGHLIESNENFAKLFDYEPHEIIGKHHRLFVDKHYRETKDYADFWQNLAQGKTFAGEFKRINRHEQTVYIQAAYTPLKDRLGNVTGVIKIASNITDQKIASNISATIKNAIDLSFAFIQFDPLGKIIEANDIFVKTMGYDDKNEIIGEHHSIFVEEGVKNSKEYELFWNDLKTGNVQQGEFRRIKKNKNPVWLQAAYSPVKNELSAVESVVKIATDVTIQKNSAHSLQNLQNVIDLSFGFIVFSTTGIITDVNKNFYGIMGYDKKSEVVGKHHSIFMYTGEAQSEAYKQFWKNLNLGITQQGEFKRKGKNNEEVWIQASYTPLKNDKGEITSIIKIATDITVTKKAVLHTKYQLRDETLNNLQEISGSIVEIASGAKDQAIKTDSISSQVEKALGAANETSNKASLIKSNANKAVNESKESESSVQELVEAMKMLNQVAQETQSSMAKLVNRTLEIEQVLKAIREIAGQTNLLALNASIEAAQAGDYGRGFGVIATEIRKLAESSATSAKEIETLVHSIKENTGYVSNTMKEVVDKVQKGSSATNVVQDIIKRMSQSTLDASHLSESILEAANYQTQNMKEIMMNIEDIVVISEETAAGSEELAAATNALKNRVGEF